MNDLYSMLLDTKATISQMETEMSDLTDAVVADSSSGTGDMADRNSKGHGEVETATRFPLLHTLDGDGITAPPVALH